MTVQTIKQAKRLLPVREQTYRILKEKILNGHFKPNNRLVEESLADLLGVSRTPIREALHKLELEGLVKKGGPGGSVSLKRLQRICLNSSRSGQFWKVMPFHVSAKAYRRKIFFC